MAMAYNTDSDNITERVTMTNIPTDEQVERWKRALELVQRIAAPGFGYVDWHHGYAHSGYAYCMFCGESLTIEYSGVVDNSDDHDPDCIWREAKRLVEEQ